MPTIAWLRSSFPTTGPTFSKPMTRMSACFSRRTRTTCSRLASVSSLVRMITPFSPKFWIIAPLATTVDTTSRTSATSGRRSNSTWMTLPPVKSMPRFNPLKSSSPRLTTTTTALTSSAGLRYPIKLIFFIAFIARTS